MVQAQLLVVEVKVTKLEATQAQHFATHIEFSQKVKTAKLFLFVTIEVKLTLEG
jgi:hypothetical protein